MYKITYDRTGVIKLDKRAVDDFIIDSDDVIEYLSDRIDEVAPFCTDDGAFAGRVKIEIEFLGKFNGDLINEPEIYINKEECGK